MKHQRLLLYALLLILLTGVCACEDEESFSVSPSSRLFFSVDTVKLDTVFSNVPTAMKSFWVYNLTGDGIRCSNVRLERGNQTGFRVNVDGIYLGQEAGYQTNEIEIRKGDSIRVFVELTSPMNRQQEPKKLEDNLVFTLENGAQQKVCLNAYTWDATLLNNVHIDRDSIIGSERPIVIYGGITVDSLCTLTIAAGTTLYFHNNAGIDVYGQLICNGTDEQNVVLRGDRIDRMFDYLPYDNVSGQWQGIHLYESSYNNKILYTDIHSTYHGIVADSSDVEQLKLDMLCSTIHNCQGYGMYSENCQMKLRNCQLTNTLGNCLRVEGGRVEVNSCTLAQFYPFDSMRRAALAISSLKHNLIGFSCLNTLITGYADDEFMGYHGDEEKTFNFLFDHCVIRTPKVETDDSVYFKNIIFEDISDTITTGIRHFSNIDTHNLRYDFRLDSVSCAIGKADATTVMPADRNGIIRKETPDIGAYEYKPETINP